MRQTLVFAVILLGGMVAARPALAHKSFIFATIPQKNIEGEVYFNGGEPGRNVTVMVLDPTGNKLGAVTTDEKGRFIFEPRVRCDHQLIADDGLGHRAEYTVKADELPSALPVGDSGDSHGSAIEPGSSSAHRHDESSGAAHVESVAPSTESVSHQIAGLRRDLDKWQARMRLQDILGGVGYIFGITGLLFYFLGVRRKETPTGAAR